MLQHALHVAHNLILSLFVILFTLPQRHFIPFNVSRRGPCSNMVAAHVHDHRTSKRFLTLISLIAMRNMTATATMMTATAANEFSNSAAKTVMMMTSTAANECERGAPWWLAREPCTQPHYVGTLLQPADLLTKPGTSASLEQYGDLLAGTGTCPQTRQLFPGAGA